MFLGVLHFIQFLGRVAEKGDGCCKVFHEELGILEGDYYISKRTWHKFPKMSCIPGALPENVDDCHGISLKETSFCPFFTNSASTWKCRSSSLFLIRITVASEKKGSSFPVGLGPLRI